MSKPVGAVPVANSGKPNDRITWKLVSAPLAQQNKKNSAEIEAYRGSHQNELNNRDVFWFIKSCPNCAIFSSICKAKSPDFKVKSGATSPGRYFFLSVFHNPA